MHGNGHCTVEGCKCRGYDECFGLNKLCEQFSAKLTDRDAEDFYDIPTDTADQLCVDAANSLLTASSAKIKFLMDDPNYVPTAQETLVEAFIWLLLPEEAFDELYNPDTRWRLSEIAQVAPDLRDPRVAAALRGLNSSHGPYKPAPKPSASKKGAKRNAGRAVKKTPTGKLQQ
jgi:hypothetical protein